MALKYIEKKSIAKLPPASGSVSDTLNVTDKVTNAPSIRLVEEIVENITGSSAIEVPKKTSDLENDSGFITADDIPDVNVPTKVSQLENDTGYVTSSAVPKKISQLTNDSGYITADEIPDIDVDVPTKTSELTNDSGFITSSSVPTKISQLTNDKGYITANEIPEVDVPTKVSELENDSGYITEETVEVSDVLDVADKTTMAPSIRLAESISGVPTEGIIAFDGTEDDIPEGYEKCEAPGGSGSGGSIDITEIANLIYPIGSVFIDESVDANGNSTDYSNRFGFTWERTLQGVMPIGINANDTDFAKVGNTGGSKTHTQTVEEMPSHTHIQNAHTHTQNAHNHTYTANSWWGGNGQSTAVAGWSMGDSTRGQAKGTMTSTTATNQNTTATNQNTGGGQAMNIMNPYKVVAYWKRIA